MGDPLLHKGAAPVQVIWLLPHAAKARVAKSKIVIFIECFTQILQAALGRVLARGILHRSICGAKHFFGKILISQRIFNRLGQLPQHTSDSGECMVRSWMALLFICGLGVVVLSCGDPQELVSIQIQPGAETFGASNIPVLQDAGLQAQLTAMGTYVHPPVTKDITNQVTWASNFPQAITVTSSGLLTVTGNACGGSIISATVQTNADASGLSASGAVVTGNMTASVTCFTGTGPTITIDFAGTGTGTISSSPAGLGCSATPGSSCTGSFPTGTTVTLTAVPNGVFGGWAGCSINGGTTCTIENLTSDVTVTATFN